MALCVVTSGVGIQILNRQMLRTDCAHAVRRAVKAAPSAAFDGHARGVTLTIDARDAEAVRKRIGRRAH